MTHDADRMIISGDVTRSAADALLRARKIAAALRAMGVGQGDSVALLLRNSVEFLEISNGIGRLGAYPVPLNWHLSPSEVSYVLQDCGAKILFVHDSLLPLLAEVATEGLRVISLRSSAALAQSFGQADTALQYPDLEEIIAPHAPLEENDRTVLPESTIYTSGTTGKPKGVRRQPATPQMRARLLEMRETVYGLKAGIRLLVPAPLYHAAPNVFSLRGLEVADLLVVMPKFDPEEFLRLIQEHRITNLVMVPTMFVRLLRLPPEVRAKYDLSSLRYVLHAAAPCPPEVKRQMIDWFGPIIGEWYGTTETSVVTLSLSQDWLRFPGTVGRAIKGAEIRIFREDGTEALPDEAGEVYMRLDCMPDFTYQNRATDRAAVGHQGLVTGGDIGYLNAEGYLFICDRKKDMVISGGVNIYPAEIEGELLSIPQIRDCAVIGVPDAEFGEALLALIVTDQPITEAKIRAHLQGKIARYKIPRTFEFRDSLPRDDVGKLLKRKLRAPYWPAATA